MSAPDSNHAFGGPAFVDTHVHFFDFGVPGLRWSWLEADGGAPVGDVANVRTPRFTPAELWAEGARLGRIRKCVHVEAAVGTADPVLETRWLSQLRVTHGAPHAAVVRVPLQAPSAGKLIEAHLQYDFVRGVRDRGTTRQMLGCDYVHQVRSLASRGLLFELFCTAARFTDVVKLARLCPDTVIVLEHFGLPPHPSDGEAFSAWARALTALGSPDNVYLKMSGLGLMDRQWNFSDVDALVDVTLSTFPIHRCIVGSNWPLDRAASSYPDMLHALLGTLEKLSEAERTAILATNAEKLYAI